MGASRDAEFGADLVFAVGAAGGNVGVGFSDRLPDSGLRQPVQRLLQRFPLVGADRTAAGAPFLVMVIWSCVDETASTNSLSLPLIVEIGSIRIPPY
ncbi:Uncharacterised protein [Mycobacterium tuberculosis]|nr:Uncharacterised protein [Mycobacterium tuberculosis]